MTGSKQGLLLLKIEPLTGDKIHDPSCLDGEYLKHVARKPAFSRSHDLYTTAVYDYGVIRYPI